jgi:hypothetical protein
VLVAGLVGVASAALLTSRPSGAGVSFGQQVQPIFDAKCVSCHPTSYPYLDLRGGRSYRQLVRVTSPLAPAFERVLAGRPELSYLLTHPPEPSNQRLLSPAERRLIARWISEGAKNN